MFNEKRFPDLRIERDLDQRTGEIAVQYFWKNSEVAKVAISGAVVRRYAGLNLIQRDLQNAWRWAQFAARLSNNSGLPESAEQEQGNRFYALDDREMGDLIKGLFVASLSYYAKAFNSAEGRRVRLSKDMLDKDFRPQHDQFMEYRNKLAAHAGSNELESMQPYIVLVPAKKGEFDYKLAASGKQADFGHNGNPEQFPLLIEHVLTLVLNQGLILANRIMHAISSLPSTHWQRASEAGTPYDIDYLVHSISQ